MPTNFAQSCRVLLLDTSIPTRSKCPSNKLSRASATTSKRTPNTAVSDRLVRRSYSLVGTRTSASSCTRQILQATTADGRQQLSVSMTCHLLQGSATHTYWRTSVLCSLVRRSKQPGRKEHSEDRLLRKQHHQPEPENRREDLDQDDGLHNAQPGTHRVVGAAQRRRRVAGASHTGRCRDPGAAGPNPEGDRRRAEEGRGNHR